MKTLILPLAFILVSWNSYAQKSNQVTFNKQIQALKASSSFKAKAIEAYAASMKDCWEKDTMEDCTDLKDPWPDDDDRTPPSDTTSARITAFYSFENDIGSGKAGLALPANAVNEAWKRSPGYSLKAMRARIEFYSLKIGHP
jgi:hypothetical protein